MDIIETIRKYIESKSSITIQKYCCNEMKDFEQFITETHFYDIGAHGYLSIHGLVVRFKNDDYHYPGRPREELIDISFTMKYCPFCGEKIIYKVINKEISEK